MGRQNHIAVPRAVFLFLFLVNLTILGSTYLWATANGPDGQQPTSTVRSQRQSLMEQQQQQQLTALELEDSAATTPRTPATAESEKGDGGVGHHFHVNPSASSPSARISGCEYPLLIHVTPDIHCLGALTTYASIVRNVMAQPRALRDKVCVHITYVDENMTTIEDMYRWKARPNPYVDIADCAALDSSPELNQVVPVRFQALPPIEKPDFMEARSPWLAALNKVHSWGMDLYPRILLVDADSIILTDVHKIFGEMASDVTIAGAADQYESCHDRTRINGGMILLKPSRYFHISALELLHDKRASCFSGNWHQSEQELLNCICGLTYDVHRPIRPEFQCRVMPLYNSVWPRSYGCSGANVVPIRSIHFAAGPKPWLIDDATTAARPDTRYWKCLGEAARKRSLDELKSCKTPTLDDTRDLPRFADLK